MATLNECRSQPLDFSLSYSICIAEPTSHVSALSCTIVQCSFLTTCGFCRRTPLHRQIIERQLAFDIPELNGFGAQFFHPDQWPPRLLTRFYYLSIYLSGRAICSRRGPPPLLRQKRSEFPQKRRSQREARAPNIHVSRAVLLRERGGQRTHPHGRVRRTPRARLSQKGPHTAGPVRQWDIGPVAKLRGQTLLDMDHVAL